MRFQVEFARAPSANVRVGVLNGNFRVVAAMPRAVMVLEHSRESQVRTCTDRLPVHPRPHIGGLWQAKAAPTTIVCKGYVDPPSAERVDLPCACRFPQGGYLGLIHEVEVSHHFVSVRVPDPECRGRLVWVNAMRVDATVWLGEYVVAVTGQPFADPVPSVRTNRWQRWFWIECGGGWFRLDPLYRLPPEDSIMTTLPFARVVTEAPRRARLLDSPTDLHDAPAGGAQDDVTRMAVLRRRSLVPLLVPENETPFVDSTLPIVADTGSTDVDCHVD